MFAHNCKLAVLLNSFPSLETMKGRFMLLLSCVRPGLGIAGNYLQELIHTNRFGKKLNMYLDSHPKICNLRIK
jgi:hypothetical protein